MRDLDSRGAGGAHVDHKLERRRLLRRRIAGRRAPEHPIGQVGKRFEGPRQAHTIGANDQLLTSEQYKPLVITYRNNAPVHLSDIADVVDDVVT